MLRVEGLTKNFGGLRAVDRCSFEVTQGTIHGLIGPNGSGKTTVFNLITGFLPATAGKAFFKDQEITGLPPHAITQAGIARTFQLVRVFRRMTVLENLLIGPKEQAGERLLLGVLQHAAGAPAGARAARPGVGPADRGRAATVWPTSTAATCRTPSRRWSRSRAR